MWEWFKRLSVATAGKLLGAALLGEIGIGAFVIGSWDYFWNAPWPFQAAVALSLLALGVLVVVLIRVLLHAPTGAMAPIHLRRFKWPLRRVSWDFDGYLGWGCGTGQPVVVYVFQPRLRVNWGEGIEPLAGYIECKRTGQRRELMIECGNPYVKASEIEFIPSGAWFQCQAWFSDRATNTTDPLHQDEFLRRFPGFRFVFHYEGGKFERVFPRAELELIIDRAWRHSNPPQRPSPVPRPNNA
jgi:hypothetical protein